MSDQLKRAVELLVAMRDGTFDDGDWSEVNDLERLVIPATFKRTAFVTITISVDLESETPLSDEKYWRNAAIENVMAHPGVSSAE